MHENREISSTPWKLQGRSEKVLRHERDGEVGLCRSTCEPTEQGGAILCGGWGRKGMDRWRTFPELHVPDSERESASARFAVSVRWFCFFVVVFLVLCCVCFRAC